MQILALFMIAKLVASTADSLCRFARRKYSQDCSKSPGSQGGFDGAGFVYALLPCQRHLSVGVAIEKCECLEDHRDGSVKLRARSVEQVPVFASLLVERTPRAREQSTPRYRRRPPVPAASMLVVNAIMLIRCALGLAVPNSNQSRGPRFEDDLADCIADQRRHAALRSRGSLAQTLEFFFRKINLGFLHVCHL